MNGELKARSPIRKANDAGGVGSEFEFVSTFKKSEIRQHCPNSPEPNAARLGDLLTGLNVLLVHDSNMSNKVRSHEERSDELGMQ